MSDTVAIPRISRLSAALASQIAAGEVIERPASVVKELVENSIDAGAGRIEIDIVRGGTQRIRVRDDGCGIHPDDMQLALESHATSKIGAVSDLAAIHSLGFRGEALASIAAVSVFELTSRIRAMDRGWRIRRDGRETPAPVPAAHAVGTTVIVDNLFQPVPARRRFLRSERTEYLHILEMARRLALSQPGLELQLRHNHKVVLLCRGEPDYGARLRAVLGEAFGRRARYLDRRGDGMRLWGWLGGQDLSRSQSDRQYFYLNGRMIRDRRISHAIRRALETAIPAGRYPSYVLHLEIDPAVTDVNVHPTKQEVRFQRARDVHDFIHAAAREGMQAPAGDNPVFPARAHPPPAGRRPAPAPTPTLQELAALYETAPAAASSAAAGAGGPRLLASLYGRYLLAQSGERVFLVDARRALHLALEQRLGEGLRAGGLASRPLLVPVLLECSPGALEAVQARQELLTALGLELAPAGPASLRLRAIPVLLQDADSQSLVRAVLERLQAPGPAPAPQALCALLAEHGAAAAIPVTTGEDLATVLAALEAAGLDPEAGDRAGVWRALEARDLARWLEP